MRDAKEMQGKLMAENKWENIPEANLLEVTESLSDCMNITDCQAGILVQVERRQHPPPLRENQLEDGKLP